MWVDLTRRRVAAESAASQECKEWQLGEINVSAGNLPCRGEPLTKRGVLPICVWYLLGSWFAECEAMSGVTNQPLHVGGTLSLLHLQCNGWVGF